MRDSSESRFAKNNECVIRQSHAFRRKEQHMQSLTEKSPLGTLIEHLKKGELAYQVTEDGKPIYYPRAVAPVTGGKLEWRVSKGLGTVYSTTAVNYKGEPPLNVALVDMDEGFRLMSRV